MNWRARAERSIAESRRVLAGKAWGSLLYAAAWEEADAATQRVLGAVWNAKLRAGSAQSVRARAKAKPFDDKVRTILSNVESRRRVPIPPRERAGIVARAIRHNEGGNVESIRRHALRSLKRQGLR